MKHGFIAMLDKRFPTVCLAIKDMMYNKIIANFTCKYNCNPLLCLQT